MLTGKSALITGSTQGIGLAIATRLAAQGCNVMLNGLGHPDEIEANRKRVEQAGNVRALFDPADLADAGQVARLVERTIAAFGGIDILVNNAVVRYFAPIEQFKPEDWDHALAVNLSSAFHTTRLALPGMRQRDFGRIVNMASIYGLRAVVNRVDYVTTKTAMIGFTRAVALETAKQNITCNAICPGASPTPSIEQRFEAFMAKEKLPRAEAEKLFMGSRQPSGRFVAADRIGGLVAFLCGPDGADITGAAISIDGGWSTS
ncbi:MAG: SDR family oxidoreductase [Reyranella sp.]|uniref:SDR family NAD(P)-dependent oxidoreductase n=1 Tax=Reyranella sp. TaxID=1929291 RepID=UPI001ACEC338|nr:SDR family NAD(P)-dependent oxidoreductase [Reyranella sp.]MBN9088784.1 SDR family oxidoreductase [Reyranella sp.]